MIRKSRESMVLSSCTANLFYLQVNERNSVHACERKMDYREEIGVRITLLGRKFISKPDGVESVYESEL